MRDGEGVSHVGVMTGREAGADSRVFPNGSGSSGAHHSASARGSVIPYFLREVAHRRAVALVVILSLLGLWIWLAA